MSQITTFYSYKGGVGRSMALANVSILLAKWGHKVLVVDWDLEAPGLEHFYKGFFEPVLVEQTIGVIDLLQPNEQNSWKDALISLRLPESEFTIDLISAGKRDEDYFKKVRDFDVYKFYEENDGGDIVEHLRNEWLANYDYILIDSRTGITEIGGICTIQLPDLVVMLFTATDQGFNGTLDIMRRASIAQQKLSFDRMKLIFLPIPSRFETNTEYELSQKWLRTFADELEDIYNDWLPEPINRKDFLELTKIPYVPYFSFGEKLPVIEQGVKDPSGLGYAYENLASIVGNKLSNVDILIQNRENFISDINKKTVYKSEVPTQPNAGNIELRLKRIKNIIGETDGIEKREKNRDNILNCFSNIVYPLLDSINSKTQLVYNFFQNRNEYMQISYLGKGYEVIGREKYKEYVTKDENIQEIKHLLYYYSFNNFLKTDGDHFTIQSSIAIKFLRFNIEIAMDDSYVILIKEYNDTLSQQELDSLTSFFIDSSLAKIEEKLLTK